MGTYDPREKYQMMCPQCRTTGELTPHPDRAENQTQKHNRMKHGMRAVADVVVKRSG